MKKVITYAQNREDLYIKSFFPDVFDGFYVDIGAYDPVVHSVTKYFYDEGWSGINVEPQVHCFKKLKAERSRDVNLNVGVSDKKGKLKLREFPGGGLSTFSSDMKSLYKDDEKMRKISYKDYEVDVVTLKDVFDYADGRKVNFLKVDVEGLEYQVLQGNDWKKNRPELICIESNHIIKEWHGLLKNAGYNKVFFDGLNEYFLADESMHRMEKFSFPKLFLDGKDIIPYEASSLIAELKKQMRKLYKDQEDQKKRYEDQINVLSKQYQVLENKTLSIKFNAVGLVKSILRPLKRLSNKVRTR